MKMPCRDSFVDAAKIWLDKLAAQDNFTVDYIQDTSKIDDAFLAHYQLFIQLNYPPYNWTPMAAAAFEKYIDDIQELHLLGGPSMSLR
jgi:hypothetical protein